MTLKEELGFLYRDMIRHKMWNDYLAEKETNKERKQAYKGEAYMAVTVASSVERMVSHHFKEGSKDVREWLDQAKKEFAENTKR